MTELCGAGWLVSGTPFWAPDHGAMWVRPDVADIDAAYEAAWQAREDGTLPKAQAQGVCGAVRRRPGGRPVLEAGAG